MCIVRQQEIAGHRENEDCRGHIFPARMAISVRTNDRNDAARMLTPHVRPLEVLDTRISGLLSVLTVLSSESAPSIA